MEFQLQYDAQKEKERRAAAVAMGYANREFNAMLRAEKEKKMKEKKEEDIRQLQELLDQIRAAEEEEQMAKVARREDTKRYMEALREAMGQDADNEAEMERLWQQENEKAWAKREAQWAKDQDARDNLLRQVFEERSRQLEAKQNIIHEERAQRKRDKEQLLEQMEAAAQVQPLVPGNSYFHWVCIPGGGGGGTCKIWNGEIRCGENLARILKYHVVVGGPTASTIAPCGGFGP